MTYHPNKTPTVVNKLIQRIEIHKNEKNILITM